MSIDPSDPNLSESDRRRAVAEILARGLLRWRKQHTQNPLAANSGDQMMGGSVATVSQPASAQPSD